MDWNGTEKQIDIYGKSLMFLNGTEQNGTRLNGTERSGTEKQTS
jgi:hypothetical protein